MDDATSMFSKGGRKKSADVDETSDDKTADDKRNASRRNTLLKKAPAYVQQRWDEICSLNSRKANKNAEKTKFTDMILKDHPGYEDVYWQTSVTDKLTKKLSAKGKWMLRTRAETLHGGGAQGARAVQDAIDAGIFEEQEIVVNKKGKNITISKVKVFEETEEHGREFALESKKRAGGRMEREAFNDAIHEMDMNLDLEVMKKPSGAGSSNDTPTITAKKRASAQMLEDRAETTTLSDTPMKKPAAATPKKMGHTMQVTAANLAQLNKENAEKNIRVNSAMRNAMGIISTKTTCALTSLDRLHQVGINDEIKKAVVTQLTTVIDDMKAKHNDLQTCIATKQAVEHMDNKHSLLDECAKLMNAVNDILRTADSTLPKLPSKASRAKTEAKSIR